MQDKSAKNVLVSNNFSFYPAVSNGFTLTVLLNFVMIFEEKLSITP